MRDKWETDNMIKRFRQVTTESPNNIITSNANNQRIMYDMYRDLKVSVLGGNLRESGSEFQRTLPEYTRLQRERERESCLLYTSDAADER